MYSSKIFSFTDLVAKDKTTKSMQYIYKLVTDERSTNNDSCFQYAYTAYINWNKGFIFNTNIISSAKLIFAGLKIMGETFIGFETIKITAKTYV